MAPALVAASPEPGPQPTKGEPVDTQRIAPSALPFTLYRMNTDKELVSEHPDFRSGWSAGTRAVTVEDTENAYSLYRGERRVAKFGHCRLMSRFNAELASEMLGMMS
jgi:hypothetical protein